MKQRVFVYHDQLVGEDSLKLTKEQVKHVLKACRLQVGDELELLFEDVKCQVVVNAIREDLLTFKLKDKSKLMPDSLRFTLFQAIPKQDKFSDICRACTEAGIHQIIPIKTLRTEVKPSANKLERWQQVLNGAALQSQCDRVPELSKVISLKDLDASSYFSSDREVLRLLFWEEASLEQGLAAFIQEQASLLVKCPLDIQFLIGPEGGLSQDEVAFCKDLGFHALSLGKTVLRVEHAAFYALAQLKALLVL
eukprot:COSAG01_NODE_69_length_28801_cov_10.460038_6_plen_251_part_00